MSFLSLFGSNSDESIDGFFVVMLVTNIISNLETVISVMIHMLFSQRIYFLYKNYLGLK